MSRDTLSKNHHISESFISDGTKELRQKNLLDIKYGELEGKNYSQRDANEYTPQPLYDPQDLKKDLKFLEDKHGKEKLNRAVLTASLVFEENNLRTVKVLIDLEDQYGESTVQEAAKKIAEKNPDNPKRSAGYLINMVKSMSQDSNATK